MNLQGAKILITGGTSGIGKATAKMLAEAGAHVAVTGRDAEKTAKTAAEIGAIGICADVSKPEDVQRTFQELQKHWGGSLDALINNAGVGGTFQTLENLDIQEMKDVFEVNVFGAAMMAQEAFKIFKGQKSGNIINIASTASLKGFARGTSYASSKFALRCMTQCWQAEMRPFNVRVIQINPSEVPTAFGREDRQEKPEQDNKLTSVEIALSIKASLEMDDRGFIPELTVWATNPF